MANIVANLTIPTTNTTGTPVDVSGMGADKTISVVGAFVGVVVVKASHDGVNYQQVAGFTGPGQKTVKVVAQYMVVQMKSYGTGAPTCSVSALAAQTSYETPPLPTTNGAGTQVDVSRFGTPWTILVSLTNPKTFVGPLMIETSSDGVTWTAAAGLSAVSTSLIKTVDLSATYVRVSRAGYTGVSGAGDAVVTIAAVLPENAASHAIGGPFHSASTLTDLQSKITGAVLAALGVSQQWTKNQRGAVVALTYGATIALDADLGNSFEVTLAGATAQLLNPSNLVKGMAWQVIVNQDATGGRALTFGSQYDFGAEGAPNLTDQTANKTALISCYAVSTTQILATVLKGFA